MGGGLGRTHIDMQISR